jgi:hypothetical protein
MKRTSGMSNAATSRVVAPGCLDEGAARRIPEALVDITIDRVGTSYQPENVSSPVRETTRENHLFLAVRLRILWQDSRRTRWRCLGGGAAVSSSPAEFPDLAAMGPLALSPCFNCPGRQQPGRRRSKPRRGGTSFHVRSFWLAADLSKRDTMRWSKRRGDRNLSAKNPRMPTPDAPLAATTAAVVMQAGHMGDSSIDSWTDAGAGASRSESDNRVAIANRLLFTTHAIAPSSVCAGG